MCYQLDDFLPQHVCVCFSYTCTIIFNGRICFNDCSLFTMQVNMFLSFSLAVVHACPMSLQFTIYVFVQDHIHDCLVTILVYCDIWLLYSPVKFVPLIHVHVYTLYM